MADSLLGRSILCFKRGIRGDVLRHVFGPNDFLRKQIKAKRKKIERRNLPEQLDFDLPLRI
jgi:hypothetical protein